MFCLTFLITEEKKELDRKTPVVTCSHSDGRAEKQKITAYSEVFSQYLIIKK